MLDRDTYVQYGKQAYEGGWFLYDNPYGNNTFTGEAWKEGWRRAKKDPTSRAARKVAKAG